MGKEQRSSNSMGQILSHGTLRKMSSWHHQLEPGNHFPMKSML
jgi:hypothetical protein